MPVSETDCELIIRYLNNELPEEEEIIFVKRLSDRPELQQAFDLELILRSHALQTDKNELPALADISFETADDFLTRAENTLAATPTNHENQKIVQTPVVNIWNYKKTIAAAAVLVLVAVSVFYFVNRNSTPELANKKNTRTPIDRNLTNIDTGKRQVTIDTNAIVPNENLLADIGQTFYKRYQHNTDDPVEIGMYYNHYQAKEFRQVLDAQETDYITKGGVDDEQDRIQQYMLFYKALANLESKTPQRAVTLLKTVVQKKDQQQELYYRAQWYLLMAYLKLQDKQNAQKIAAAVVSEKDNPYRLNAMRIQELLTAKR